MNLPVTFRLYKGETQPTVGALEIVLWRDETADTEKILMRLEDQTRVFVPGDYVPLPSAPDAYTATNVTTDRDYDADSTTLDEVADVLGTLIADLQARGLIG